MVKNKVIQNNIAVIRKEKGYSQMDFAKEVGISHWWLNHIERGKHNPSLSLAIKIAEKLGVTPNDIFLD